MASGATFGSVMLAIDTNVLVRLIIRDDESQATAADAFVAKGAWVSVLALAEATWVLTSVYEVSHKGLARAIEMLLNHRDLALQYPEAIAAALDLYRTRPTLGFSDCLMLQLGRREGHLPLGTFDRNLAKIPGAHRVHIESRSV
jgi:predicted nucleic-acid-binding protein